MLGNFFSMDGPFFKYGSLVFDLLILNFVWAFLSGPLAFILIMVYAGQFILALPAFVFYLLFIFLILQIGPATTALFYVTNRKVRDSDGYLMKDFFKSYKMNYKQALLITGILFIIIFILSINISAILGLSINIMGVQLNAPANMFGGFGKILLPLQLFLLLEVIFVTIFIYPMLARFHMPTKDLIKTAFIIANKHLFTSIISLATFVALIALGLMVHGIFFFFLISGYAMLTSYLFEKVFKKYIPNEDDEVERELEEMNQEEEYDYDLEQASLAEVFRKKREENKDK